MSIRLNLGCGANKKPGYINVDIDEKVNPDILADVSITPWVWVKMNSCDRIEMNNLAEHLVPFIKVIKECWYALENGGILWIKVPFLKTDGGLEKFLESVMDCYSDPTHIGLKFTTRTFDYFDCNHSRWKNFGKSYGIPKFKRVKQQIKDRFLIVELQVVK